MDVQIFQRGIFCLESIHVDFQSIVMKHDLLEFELAAARTLGRDLWRGCCNRLRAKQHADVQLAQNEVFAAAFSKAPVKVLAI